MVGVFTIMCRHICSSIIPQKNNSTSSEKMADCSLFFLFKQYFKNPVEATLDILWLKQEPDQQEPADQQDQEQDGQQVKIFFNKIPNRCTELIDQGSDQEKAGRSGNN